MRRENEEEKMKKKTLCVMTTALACVTAGAATNYDLLGRKASKMNSPMVYKDADHMAIKKNGLGGDNLQAASVAVKAAYRAEFDEGIYNHDRGSDGLPTKNFITYQTYYNTNCYSLYHTPNARYYFGWSQYDQTPVIYNFSTTPYTVNGAKTATGYDVSFSKTNSDKLTIVGISSSYNDYVYLQFKNFDEVPYSQSGKAFPYENLKYNYYNFSDDYVGIYVDTKAYPAWLKDQTPSKFFLLEGSVLDNITCQAHVPTPNDEYNATLLNYAMPGQNKGAYTFIHNSKCEKSPYPENPSSRDPQIYMGVHAAEDTPTDKYTEETRELDNYIYENHMLEIVGAGNYKNNRKGLMNAKAYAANAITVGSVDTKNTMGFFSAWANAPYTNAGKTVRGQKPEIANYTDFSFFDKSKRKTDVKTYSKGDSVYTKYEVMDGTMGATAYTANMMANLIRRQPFMRYHPEMAKARLLTSSILKINDENKSGAVGIPYYPALMGSEYINEPGYEHYINKSNYWYGDINRMFTKVSGKNQYELFIPFTVKPGYKYRAAISWLSSGDDIATYNRVPQDFDLFLVDNSGKTLASASNNGATPYELLSYTATQEQTVKVKILLYEDINGEGHPRHHKIKLGFNFLEYKE
ncbi:hypothetical protein B7993_08410 [Fibrobacter sp. UWH3]|nr:hypothetical protein B7993_08410 [Fibrobacter sp. UWH3]